MRKLTHQEVVKRQIVKKKGPRLPFVVVLNNVRSLYNVGSIFRSADGAGISHLYLCGITGYPPHSQITKTALGAEEHVSWSYRQDTSLLIQELKEQGYEIIMLEQTSSSIPYENFQPSQPVALILGNEIEGISSSLVSQCDRAIEIDMAGSKNSLNVAVAFGVVAFQIKNLLQKGVHYAEN